MKISVSQLSGRKPLAVTVGPGTPTDILFKVCRGDVGRYRTNMAARDLRENI